MNSGNYLFESQTISCELVYVVLFTFFSLVRYLCKRKVKSNNLVPVNLYFVAFKALHNIVFDFI